MREEKHGTCRCRVFHAYILMTRTVIDQIEHEFYFHFFCENFESKRTMYLCNVRRRKQGETFINKISSLLVVSQPVCMTLDHSQIADASLLIQHYIRSLLFVNTNRFVGNFVHQITFAGE